MWKYKPDRYPDEMLTRGLPGQIAFFIMVAFFTFAVLFMISSLFFWIDIFLMLGIALAIALVATKSGIDQMKSLEKKEA